VLLCGGLLLIPLLALHHGSKSSPSAMVRTESFVPAGATRDALPRASRSNHRALAAPSQDAAVIVTAPSTTEAPVDTTVVTAAPVRAAVVHRRPAPTTTTTAKPKPKSTTTTTRPPSSSSAPAGSSTAAQSGDGHTGKASWYEDAPPGTCAHKTLPKGTVVTVTDVKTGKSVQCTVADRGPYVDGYIIDLSKDTFEKLAPLSQGIVQARIDW
jgi:rare lipoprotein A (peptidoglycan hydrolase)